MEIGFQETKLMILKRVIEEKDKIMRVKSTVDYYANKSEYIQTRVR